MRNNYDIAIIGGGASGIIAAITAARKNSELKIGVFEKNARVGKKILSTGNGRCNLTNQDQNPAHYHGKNTWFINEVLRQFSLEETVAFFNSIGIEIVSEGDKLFPHSLQATSVLDLLRYQLQQNNIEELCECCCQKIEKQGNKFLLRFNDGKSVLANKVKDNYTNR